MKLAIVPEKTIKYIREYCNEMEEAISTCKEYSGGEDQEEAKNQLVAKAVECSTVFHHIQHIILAYETIFSNACDPELSHIEFNKEIKEFLDSKDQPKEVTEP